MSLPSGAPGRRDHPAAAKSWRMGWGFAALIAVAGIAMGGSYFGVTAWRTHQAVARLEVQPTVQPYPTGTYLIAYVMISSKCHFCTGDSAKATIRGLRAVLRRAANSHYAGVSVVGVLLDPDEQSEMQFLRSLGGADTFDQISIGGGG